MPDADAATPDPIAAAGPLAGAQLIANEVKRLPNAPGVYRMIDQRGEVLYVGKAKSLKKRVANYAKSAGLPARILRMVALTRAMEFVETNSEVEALLLEANMIKRLRPSFNIVLRDDKSFPYIFISRHHAYPQIGKHRGSKREGVEYFGPFASAGAVNETLNALLRAFPLRNCRDAYFANRSRPCLQYQIKRCSAPCVGRISETDYAELVDQAGDFLNGRSREIQARLQKAMLAASEAMQFEQAAALRDRIKAMAHITARQGINTEAVDDADLIALHREGGSACVQVFFYRDGRNYGNRAYYPGQVKEMEDGELMAGFLGQFYAERAAPPLILLSHMAEGHEVLAEALAVRAERKVRLRIPQRGDKRALLDDALRNAQAALARRLADQANQTALLEQLAELLELPDTPQRIEVYDNSHIMGTNAVGAYIVAGPDGFMKQHYRKYNITSTTLTPGDDFAMMREVLTRRLQRLLKDDPGRDKGLWPDLLLIDGGAGQLSSALQVAAQCGVSDVPLVAIAKGVDRNAGREVLHMAGRTPFSLPMQDPVLYYLQRLRDEAHRFAITTHRAKRTKDIKRSKLDEVPGIGPARKKALLNHFGAVALIERASLADIEAVPGVNKAVAKVVYDHFHEG